MAFLNGILACFRAPAKALIAHCTTFKNHLETNGLIEWIVQSIKHQLWKYGLFHSNHYDWNLILPWIVIDYYLNIKVSLASYNFYYMDMNQSYSIHYLGN